MSQKTQSVADVDFEKQGKQQGFIMVPYSDNIAGWAKIQIPITAVNHGTGPTLLAIGGNHGDECQGPIALMKLAAQLEPEDIQGRVIIIPALNLLAVRAGTRLSPLDGVNLNRAFPGEYNDTPTGLIAHYVTNVLFPLSDIVMDIHTGGRSMNFLPVAHLHRVPDEDQFQKMLAAVKAWGTPYVFIYRDIAGEGLLPVQAEQMGKLVVTTEMGGGGQCDPRVLAITERGIRNVMIHFGIMEGQLDSDPESAQVISATEQEDYHFSPADGLYETFYEVGDEVKAGEPLGQVHFPESFDRSPKVVIAQSSGILVSRKHFCLTRSGDCVGTIARPVDL